MTAHAEVAEDGGIITVTIDRQEKLNAISPEVTEKLWEAVLALGDRDDLRCMVITAKGRYFTAGIDLGASTGNRRAPADAELRHPGWAFRRNYRTHHLLYDEMETVEKPIVLAAQGTCLGAGVEMAVSCDFRFCTPAVEWGVPEVHLGVIAGSGGTTRLTRIVGVAWAKWMAMAGRRVDADTALRIGLVQEVFPEATFMDDVYAFCRDLCQVPPETLGLAKAVIDLAGDVPDRGVQRTVDRLANTSLVGGEDHLERTRRFQKDPGNERDRA